ncbi:hypothetical protein ABZT17_25130 [Streptomyces sp. NPDC005648]|uniref:TRADD-N-associated membrane domain-containing protein n=1 Tax=Streptomyces sp. NPDC005648 TaxID=3157044 RepID=UPI0033A1597C
MVTTTDDGDDHPEVRPAEKDAFARALLLSKWLKTSGTSYALEQVGQETLKRLIDIGGAAHTDQQVVQAAGEVNNVFISHGPGVAVTPEPADQKPSLAERRQEFHFDVLKLKLKHAQWMLSFSVVAVAAGLVAMLVGVVLALVRTGSPQGYVTGASGLVASLGGGALHRYAKRAMDDLNDAAKRNEDMIDVDRQIEVATTLIDRVDDKDLRDRLNSTAALKALKIQPDPDTMLNRLLPGDQPRGIEPGEPTN